MTPSDIKGHLPAGSHFFDRKTMQFFGDSMRNFGVRAVIVRTAYNKAGEYVGPGGVEVPAWELYRKRPVKHGLQSSHWFARDDFRSVVPMSEAERAHA